MSIKLMSWVWENATQKGSELLLLLALADAANDAGYCWPSIETLSKKTRMSKRYIIDLLESLEQSENITREKRWDQHGDPTSNLYKLNTPSIGVVLPGALPMGGSEPGFTRGSAAGRTTGSEAGRTRVVLPGALNPLINRNSDPEGINRKEEHYDDLPDNPPDDGDPAFSLMPLSQAFVEAAGLPELSGGAQRYNEALQEMCDKGVQPEDLRQGIQELRVKNYTIVSPRSCVTAAINCMGKRKGRKNGRQPDEADVITAKMRAEMAAHPEWFANNDEEGEK